MVISCCALGCAERFVKGGQHSFHKFPKDEEIQKKWVHNIQRKNFRPCQYSKVCSKHFTDDCFEKEAFGFRTLVKSAVPTLFDFSSHTSKKKQRKKSSLKCGSRKLIKISNVKSVTEHDLTTKSNDLLTAPDNSEVEIVEIKKEIETPESSTTIVILNEGENEQTQSSYLNENATICNINDTETLKDNEAVCENNGLKTSTSKENDVCDNSKVPALQLHSPYVVIPYIPLAMPHNQILLMHQKANFPAVNSQSTSPVETVPSTVSETTSYVMASSHLMSQAVSSVKRNVGKAQSCTITRRKRKYFIGDHDLTDMSSPETVANFYKQVKINLLKKNKTIDMLRSANTRLRKQVERLKSDVKQVKNQAIMTEKAARELTANLPTIVQEIYQRTVKSPTKEEYPLALKSFAVTLYLHSPKAYDYVRRTFSSCLPYPQTIAAFLRGNSDFVKDSKNN